MFGCNALQNYGNTLNVSEYIEVWNLSLPNKGKWKFNKDEAQVWPGVIGGEKKVML